MNKKYTFFTFRIVFTQTIIYTNSQLSILNIRYKFRYARKCSIKWICWRQTFVDDSIRGGENNKANPRYLFEIDSRLFHTVQKITFSWKSNWKKRLTTCFLFFFFFFYRETSSKLFRSCKLVRTDAARKFCNLNFNETNERLKEERRDIRSIRKFLSFFLFIARTSI